jgi:hypothetical protein
LVAKIPNEVEKAQNNYNIHSKEGDCTCFLHTPIMIIKVKWLITPTPKQHYNILNHFNSSAKFRRGGNDYDDDERTGWTVLQGDEGAYNPSESPQIHSYWILILIATR